MRKNYALLFFIIIVQINCFFDSNKNFENQINKVLLFDDNMHLFDKILAVNEIFDNSLDVEWTKNEINKMANEIKSEIGNEGNPEIFMNKLQQYFFKEKMFEFDNNANLFLSGKNPEATISINDWIDLHSIEKVLKRRKGICISLSLIYLIIAEKLNLPVYGVLIPGHMFVRYEQPGMSGINVETTYSGNEFYDYFSYSGIDILDKDKIIYGKLLNKRQVIAAYLNNIGLIYTFSNNLEKAKIIYKNVMNVMPDLPEVYNNLGYVYKIEKDYERAEKMFQKAIEIHPYNLLAITNLGFLYYEQKRLNKAEIYLKKSLKINPDDSYVVKLLNEIKDK
jgi:regulator of sirC expression with transglutaminase-like and TPR domain